MRSTLDLLQGLTAASASFLCAKPNHVGICHSLPVSQVGLRPGWLLHFSYPGINTPVSLLMNSQRTTEPGVRSRLFFVDSDFYCACSRVNTASGGCHAASTRLTLIRCSRASSHKKSRPIRAAALPVGIWRLVASGRQDSNLRHLAPKASALPNCATPRTHIKISA